MKSNEIESDIPKKCPKCGSELKERTGKYGKFIGCTKFPECLYTYDLGKHFKVLCPKCGKKLKLRKGRYERFLSCSGYPECKFTFNPEFREIHRYY